MLSEKSQTPFTDGEKPFFSPPLRVDHKQDTEVSTLLFFICGVDVILLQLLQGSFGHRGRQHGYKQNTSKPQGVQRGLWNACPPSRGSQLQGVDLWCMADPTFISPQTGPLSSAPLCTCLNAKVCNHFTEVWPQWQKGQTHPVTAPSLSAPAVLLATCLALQGSGFYSVPQSGTKPRHSPSTARRSPVEVIAEPGAGNPKPGQFNSLQVLGHFCDGNPPHPADVFFCHFVSRAPACSRDRAHLIN